MAYDPQQLPAEVVDFLRERHLATLTTLRADGTPHVVAVGFTYDPAAGLVRVITSGSSRKVRNLEAAGGGPAVVCQVDGRRWLALEGTGRVRREPEAIAVAEDRYAGRYRTPRVNPGRVAIEITVERVLGHA